MYWSPMKNLSWSVSQHQIYMGVNTHKITEQKKYEDHEEGGKTHIPWLYKHMV